MIKWTRTSRLSIEKSLSGTWWASAAQQKCVERFRGRLVFKAHRLLYRSTLGSRVIKKKKKKGQWVVNKEVSRWDLVGERPSELLVVPRRHLQDACTVRCWRWLFGNKIPFSLPDCTRKMDNLIQA